MSDNLKSFIVYAPYRTENDAVERRNLFRSEHAAAMAKLKENGGLQRVIMHLKPPSAAEGPETATNKPEFQAATLILKAGSYLEAQNMIHSDVFWKEDVWNKEQLVINPALILF